MALVQRFNFDRDMKRQWKIFQGVDCPWCGDSIEVHSIHPVDKDTLEETWVYDDEPVRCGGGCGWVGNTVVDEERAWVNEGNWDELNSLVS